MIYFSNAEQVIKDSIQRIKFDNQRAFQKNRTKLMDYYQYKNTAKYISGYFSKNVQAEFPLYTTNFTKRLINRISMVYKNAPVRIVGGDEETPYMEYLKNKDYQMKIIERVHNLIGTILVHLRWDYYLEKICYEPIIDYEVALNPDNPVQVMAVIYKRLKTVDDIHNTQDDIYEYWSNEQHFFIDGNGGKIKVNDDDINPYGVIPMVTVQPNTVLYDEYFNEGEGSDIATANQQLDVSMTMLQRHIRVAGGQLWIEGRADRSQIELGLNKIAQIEDGTLNSVGNLVDIQSIVDGIEHQIKHVCSNHHISFDFGLSGSKSGVALKIENLELLEARQDDAEKFRMVEKEIYETERAILEVETGRTLPDDFTVDFTEIEFPDEQADLQRWEWWFKHGIKDKVDYIMENDPDKFDSREDAIAHLEQRQTQRQEKQSLFNFTNEKQNTENGTADNTPIFSRN